jgi:hypothetical protein
VGGALAVARSLSPLLLPTTVPTHDMIMVKNTLHENSSTFKLVILKLNLYVIYLFSSSQLPGKAWLMDKENFAQNHLKDLVDKLSYFEFYVIQKREINDKSLIHWEESIDGNDGELWIGGLEHEFVMHFESGDLKYNPFDEGMIYNTGFIVRKLIIEGADNYQISTVSETKLSAKLKIPYEDFNSGTLLESIVIEHSSVKESNSSIPKLQEGIDMVTYLSDIVS